MDAFFGAQRLLMPSAVWLSVLFKMRTLSAYKLIMKLKLNFIDLLETADPSKISMESGTDVIATYLSN